MVTVVDARYVVVTLLLLSSQVAGVEACGPGGPCSCARTTRDVSAASATAALVEKRIVDECGCLKERLLRKVLLCDFCGLMLCARYALCVCCFFSRSGLKHRSKCLRTDLAVARTEESDFELFASTARLSVAVASE